MNMSKRTLAIRWPLAFRARMVAAAGLAALTATTAFAVPTDANADRYGVFPVTLGQESRCRQHPTAVLCLYWNTFDQAWWGQVAGQDDNLGGNHYWNNGPGNGQVVLNNARRLSCKTSMRECRVYTALNQGGDYNYVDGGNRGVLTVAYDLNKSTWAVPN